ncbi:hypothetical protein DKX38_004483 [Salix brachista]|uniref:Peptidase S8/S53 domain-containing protein n=1 Tax=Salix brachista TaxID=2182728 RepID=A0A5N5NAX6_9ROSI|nr:hypothetical protein DKX38_004483 [Salix brachista]
MLARILLTLTFLFSSTRAITDQVVSSSSSISIMNNESKLETYIVFLRKSEGMVSAKPEHLDNCLAPECFEREDNPYSQLLGFTAEFRILESFKLWKGVIVGVLDTGVTPNHPSFSDEGMPPPPPKWKGKCEFNGTLCNNKLIGARNFYSAVGIASSAHLAIYQVCSEFGSCSESDILAGMGTAVEDGVDVLSLSLGGPSLPFYEYSIAIGACGAIQKGIFASCAAGNSGPSSESLSNEAPWILTVGASSNGNESSALCDPGSLKDVDVRGKVMLCERGGLSGLIGKGQEVKDAGAAAMIVMNDEFSGNVTATNLHLLPASHVTHADGLSMKAFINSKSSPMATILFKGTVFC